ncbi:NAD(P)/FAD-dependent oxidoreductase [Marinobacter sp. X15-166B]|uniref:NAD(P)/FAD-dependent oxidoreductase n=1 Tax=Marinobacter sp. X15-166B TaxID=1897620 RepID=UPI00085C2A60|nr:FAD-dependent oxidoreductase [Marinobacter sp. X15-166B]OEY65938.1 ferredoxin reductase [Marinobacter sp. X15-166B]
MNNNKKAVIVGGGHAGGNLVIALRKAGFDGHITLVSDEGALPYQRPPLSKSWLNESVTLERLYLKPAAFYDEQRVQVMLNSTVERIQRNDKRLLLADGTALEYDYLVLATGARARPLALPGGEFENLHCLRNLADAERLKAQLHGATHLAVIGGGYIGLEVAASARQLGVKVSVIERESRLLARVASETLSHYYQRQHQARGVDILNRVGVAELKSDAGRLTSVVLDNGVETACDLALVGIGAIPNDELARAAGLQVDNGIVVDHQARTSDPAIFAIGDVSQRPLPVYNRQFRLENISNTLEQAKIVAAVLAEQPLPADEVPWFWSDQYDIKLQIAGLGIDTDVDIVRGDPASDKFSVFRFCGDRLMAVEAVNSPAEFMLGKKWIGAGTAVDRGLIADASVSVRDCAVLHS